MTNSHYICLTWMLALLCVCSSGAWAQFAPAVAYISNNGSGNVSVLDTATNTAIATVPVGGAPYGVAVNPSDTFVYVTNQSNNNVSVIDTVTNTVVATVPVGTDPWGVAVNPAGTFAYVTNINSNNVSVIDTAMNTVATVPVGTNPYGVAVNPAGTFAYVANRYDNTVSVIDTGTNAVVATVPVGLGPVAFGNFIGQAAVTVPVAPRRHGAGGRRTAE